MYVNTEYSDISKMFKENKGFMQLKEVIQDKTGTSISVPTEGANVYLSINLLFDTLHNIPTGKIEGVSLGITVTNYNTIYRYFNPPMFQTSIPFDNNGINTFLLPNMTGTSVTFPKRLEYGEVFSINYKLSSKVISGIIEVLRKQDPSATIKAVIQTTLGEKFYSNEHTCNKIVIVAEEAKKI